MLEEFREIERGRFIRSFSLTKLNSLPFIYQN